MAHKKNPQTKARWRAFIRRSRLYIRYRSTSVNIYHCCVHKTASRWLRAILRDPRTYRYSGLSSYRYQSTLPDGIDTRKITDRSFSAPFPQHTIVSPLYIDYGNYKTIPKPDRHKTFFVMRDPRDIVVSWYFSVRYSHRVVGRISEHRNSLNDMSIADGMLYSIEHLNDLGLFAALRSWISAPERDRNVSLFRFEELTGSQSLQTLKRLFSHCDIRMPDRVLLGLIKDHCFERLAGRERGKEEKLSHYRKGVAGDWRTYFDDTLTGKLRGITDDLAVCLGYDQSLR